MKERVKPIFRREVWNVFDRVYLLGLDEPVQFHVANTSIVTVCSKLMPSNWTEFFFNIEIFDLIIVQQCYLEVKGLDKKIESTNSHDKANVVSLFELDFSGTSSFRFIRSATLRRPMQAAHCADAEGKAYGSLN